MDNFEQSETPHQNLWTDGDSNPRPPHCPDDFGGVCWKKSEPILNEIPTDCRPSGGIPAQRLSARRRTKAAKIKIFFRKCA